ncbi:hypothetical protein PMAYCL1PPCAC_12000, partial [Pristionchus mayeri]
VLAVSQNEIVLEDLLSTETFALPRSDLDSMDGSGEDYLTPDYIASAFEPDFILSMDEPSFSVEKAVIPPLPPSTPSPDQSVVAAIEVVQQDEHTMCAPCFESCCVRLECSISPVIDSIVTLQSFCARRCPLSQRENGSKRTCEYPLSSLSHSWSFPPPPFLSSSPPFTPSSRTDWSRSLLSLSLPTMAVRNPRELHDLNQYKPGMVLGGRWSIMKLLDEGGFGRVYQVSDLKKPGNFAALKIESINMDGGSAIKLEKSALSQIHKRGYKSHVPLLYRTSKRRNICYMIVTLLGENLKRIKDKYFPGGYTLRTWSRIAIQCLFSIKVVHDAGFVHRDIKACNFMLGAATPKEQAVGIRRQAKSQSVQGETG